MNTLTMGVTLMGYRIHLYHPNAISQLATHISSVSQVKLCTQNLSVHKLDEG